jgi:hypothetical protein
MGFACAPRKIYPEHYYLVTADVELVTNPSNMSNMEQEIKRVLQHCAVV